MSADERPFLVDYERLDEILGDLGKTYDLSVEIRDLLLRHTDNLESGAWEGEGARNYYREFHDDIEPALDRLMRAMEQAQTTIKQIKGETQTLEEHLAQILMQMLGLAPDGRGPGLKDAVLSALNESSLLRHTSGSFGVTGLLEAMRKNVDARNPRLQRLLNSSRLGKVLDNRFVRVGGKAFSFLGAGMDLANFANDPNVETGIDLGVGTLGFVAKRNPYVLAFTGGYGIGKAFIAPHTTEPLSNALTEWDPLDIGYSPRNYPRTTINDFERAGEAMPMDVAKDVYVGLRKSSWEEANQFVAEYAEGQGMSVNEFRLKSGLMFW